MPTPIPTVQAQPIAIVGNHAWTLCRHIAGERLDDEPSTYRRLVAILAVIHRRLRDIDPHYAVMRESLLSRAVAALADVPDALTPNAHTATAWLRGRIVVLHGLSPQLIHGDFGIPNVLVGMIAFSRAQPQRSQLGVLARWYAEGRGQTFWEEQLAVALVAGRLANIAWPQGRLAQGEAALVESVNFLDERLGRVLRWRGQYP